MALSSHRYRYRDILTSKYRTDVENTDENTEWVPTWFTDNEQLGVGLSLVCRFYILFLHYYYYYLFFIILLLLLLLPSDDSSCRNDPVRYLWTRDDLPLSFVPRTPYVCIHHLCTIPFTKWIDKSTTQLKHKAIQRSPYHILISESPHY